MKSVNIKVSIYLNKRTTKSWYKIEMSDCYGCTTNIMKCIQHDSKVSIKTISTNLTTIISNHILELVINYTHINIHIQSTNGQRCSIITNLIAAGKNVDLISTKVTRDFYDDVSLIDNPGGRKCTICSKYLPSTDFSFVTSTRCFNNRCKKCNNHLISKYNTVRVYASAEAMIKGVVYPNMKQIILSINNISPERNLTIEFTDSSDIIKYLKEINQWELFCNNFDAYIKASRDHYISPTICRINKDIGYCKGNIKVTTFSNLILGPHIHNSGNITLTGKLHSGVHYQADRKAWSVYRTYIVNGIYHTWKSLFPSETIAEEYSAKLLNEILTYNIPRTKEIKVNDWKLLWPDKYIERKIDLVTSRGYYGHVQHIEDSYVLTLRKVGNNKLMGGIFPSRKLANEFGIKFRIMQLKGNHVARVTKRDWVALGFNDQIEFKKTLNTNGTHTLRYVHKGIRFSAYITDSSWQDKYVNDLLVNDLRLNGIITIHNIRKTDWQYIIKPDSINSVDKS